MNKADSKPLVIPANKSGNKVQIALPKLCNYDDDDDDDDEKDEDEDEKEAAKLVIQKPQPQTNTAKKAATGLLSILPQPKANLFTNAKQTSTNTAYSGKNNNEVKSTSTTTSTPAPTSSGLFLPRSLKAPISVPNEDDDIRQKNFKRFKPNKESNTAQVGKNLKSKQFIADFRDFEQQDPEIVFSDDEGRDSNKDDDDELEFKHKGTVDEEEEHVHDHDEDHSQESEPQSSGPPELNEEALMKLCGKKRAKEMINLTDVKANEIMGDTRSNLMKQITKEWKPPSNKDYFGSGSKRTHHITYLAYVAKDREQELKEIQAQNAFNRKQAKQRYGF